MADKVANDQTLALVVLIIVRMDVADNIPVLIFKHEDKRFVDDPRFYCIHCHKQVRYWLVLLLVSFFAVLSSMRSNQRLPVCVAAPLSLDFEDVVSHELPSEGMAIALT